MAIPAPVKELWTFWRDIEAKTMRSVDVALVAAPGDGARAWRETVLLGSEHAGRLASVSPDVPGPLQADLAIVVLEAAEAPWPGSFRALDRFPRDRVVAIVAGAGDPGLRRAAMRLLDLPDSQVVAATAVADLAGEVAQRCFSLHHDLVIPLARQFPVLRGTAAWEEIHATARQNALVGVIPVPGGDMPIMIANQIKMLLRMAAMFDLPLDLARAREILAVVGGGVGLRTLARQLVKVVPGPGWIVAGGMGYGGTLAMGKAALEYFRRAASARGPITVRAEDAPRGGGNGRGTG